MEYQHAREVGSDPALTNGLPQSLKTHLFVLAGPKP